MGWGQRRGPERNDDGWTEGVRVERPKPLADAQHEIIDARDRFNAFHRKLMLMNTATLIGGAGAIALNVFVLAVAPWRPMQIITCASLAVLFVAMGYTFYNRGKFVTRAEHLAEMEQDLDAMYLALSAWMLEQERGQE